MRRERRHPEGASSALVLLFVGALCLLLSGIARGGQADEAAAPVGTVSSKEALALLRNGRMMEQCRAFDYSDVFYEAARGVSESVVDPHVSLRIKAEFFIHHVRQSILYPIKGRQIVLVGSLIDPIEKGIVWATDPPTLAQAHLALAWNSAVKDHRRNYEEGLAKALEEARRAGRLDIQAECLILKGFRLLLDEKPSEALETGTLALQYYTLSRNPLLQSEAYAFLAVCHATMRNATAAENAYQKSLDTVENLNQGPVLNPEKAMALVPELVKRHPASARRHEYRKAYNEALTLLLLSDRKILHFIPKYLDDFGRGSRKKRLEYLEMVRKFDLMRGELLAYLAYYSALRGERQSGWCLLQQSEEAMRGEISPLARIRYSRISAMFWRVAGEPDRALALLDMAAAGLLRVRDPSPDVVVGVPEERGLAQLQMGRHEEGVAALNKALEAAQRVGRHDDIARLERNLKAIADGTIDIEQLTAPPPDVALEARMEEESRMGRLGPKVFRSPFAADYPQGSSLAAVNAVSRIRFSRPTPSPTPQNLTPEILIRTRQYKKAIVAIEKILRKEGDSVDRLMQLGKCSFKTRQWDKARDAFERLLKIDPGDGAAQIYLENIRKQI